MKFISPIVFLVLLAVVFLILGHLLLHSQDLCISDVFFLDLLPVFAGGGRTSILLILLLRDLLVTRWIWIRWSSVLLLLSFRVHLILDKAFSCDGQLT